MDDSRIEQKEIAKYPDNPGRILIAGHPFRGYTRMIFRAFQQCGLTASLLEWEETEKNPLENLRYAVSREYIRKMDGIRLRENSRKLESCILNDSFDYVLVINGAKISAELRRYCLQKDIKLIFWAYDGYRHFPWLEEVNARFDMLYTYEPSDVKYYSDVGNARFLPMAYDAGLYFPIDDSLQKDVDLCFIGAINFNHYERIKTLRELGRQERFKIEIWSDTISHLWPTRLIDLTIKLSGKNVKLLRKTLDHDEINRIYNRSKIGLNIHHRQSQKALNPRTFEILGSGRLLITDRSLSMLDDFTVGRDYLLYETSDDLIDIAGDILGGQDRISRIAESGHRNAKRGHTFLNRARSILTDLKRYG
jgi:spore maturation protein CgeB